MQRQQIYRVQEIFYSLQGEGANMGKPVVFVRFAGCNLACPFCDTPNTPGIEMTDSEIFLEAGKQGGRCGAVVFTGGEPTLQLTDTLVALFKESGWWVAIETNGTRPLPQGLDYVTVSPKNAPLYKRLGHINEIRVALAEGQPTPEEILDNTNADLYYLSPIFDGFSAVEANIDWVIEECKRSPAWRLSIQLHKLIGIR